MNLELSVPVRTTISNADKEMLYHYLTHSDDIQIEYDIVNESVKFFEVIEVVDEIES